MYFRRILNYFCVCLYAPAAAAPASIHPRSAWLLADAAPPLHQWVEQLEKRSLSSNLRSRKLFFVAWSEAEKSENSQSCLFWLTLNPLISPSLARRWANRCNSVSLCVFLCSRWSVPGDELGVKSLRSVSFSLQCAATAAMVTCTHTGHWRATLKRRRFDSLRQSWPLRWVCIFNHQLQY